MSDLDEVPSIIEEAQYVMKSAARHDENAENSRQFRHHAKQLGIAIDTVRDEIKQAETSGEVDL